MSNKLHHTINLKWNERNLLREQNEERQFWRINKYYLCCECAKCYDKFSHAYDFLFMYGIFILSLCKMKLHIKFWLEMFISTEYFMTCCCLLKCVVWLINCVVDLNLNGSLPFRYCFMTWARSRDTWDKH